MNIEPQALPPCRILLVEDTALTRTLTEAVLRGATYEVDSVGDGPAALRALDERAYDLVLMDLDMPGVDGHAAAAAIRRREDEQPRHWSAPRVAALSAQASEEARALSKTVGMIGHIRRPIAPSDLLREVGRLLTSPSPSVPRVWCRGPYQDLAAYLGRDRMRSYLAGLLDQCETMARAITHRTTPSNDLRRQAHDLISVGGTLGFEALSRACAMFHAAAAGSAADRALCDVVSALERTVDALRLDLAEPSMAA